MAVAVLWLVSALAWLHVWAHKAQPPTCCGPNFVSRFSGSKAWSSLS